MKSAKKYLAEKFESLVLKETGEMGQSDIEEGGEYYEEAQRLEGASIDLGKAVDNISSEESGKNASHEVLFDKVRPFDVYQGPYAFIKIDGRGARLWGTENENEFFIAEPFRYLGTIDDLAMAICGDKEALATVKSFDLKEKKMTQAEIEAQKANEEEDEDEEGVEKIQRPKGSLRKGERFGEGKVYNEAFIAKTERWLDQSFLGEGSDIGIIDKIEQLTDENDHNGAVMVLAKFLKSPQHIRIMKAIQELHDAYGHMPSQLIELRGFELKELLKDFAKRYGEQLAKKVQGAF